MADYTYEQLKEMTVEDLRKIADGIQHEAIQGHNTMHKEQLLPALCTALGIQTHHAAAGAEKARIKAALRKVQAKRDAATTARDRAALAATRRQIHVLKHKLRRLAAKIA